MGLGDDDCSGRARHAIDGVSLSETEFLYEALNDAVAEALKLMRQDTVKECIKAAENAFTFKEADEYAIHTLRHAQNCNCEAKSHPEAMLAAIGALADEEV